MIKSAKNSTEYRVFRIFKDKKVWMVEDEIIFDECITHHILINEEKIIFISASWNIYIYDARTLKRIEILTN